MLFRLIGTKLDLNELVQIGVGRAGSGRKQNRLFRVGKDPAWTKCSYCCAKCDDSETRRERRIRSGAIPYTFLIASLIVLILSAGSHFGVRCRRL